jgi:hypothetical protein
MKKFKKIGNTYLLILRNLPSPTTLTSAPFSPKSTISVLPAEAVLKLRTSNTVYVHRQLQQFHVTNLTTVIYTSYSSVLTQNRLLDCLISACTMRNIALCK